MKKSAISRRGFLVRAACGAAVVSFDAAIPNVFARTAAGLAADQGRSSRRLLVVIGLYGGNDGLNTVVPFADDEYHKARPTIGIKPERTLKLDDVTGLHPALAPFREFWDQGRLAIVQGVGYPDPSYSHFQSMDVWMTGDLRGAAAGAGWLARAAEAWPHAERGRFCATGLGPGGLPLALQSPRIVLPAIASLEQYEFQTDSATPDDKVLEREIIRSMCGVESASDPALVAHARRVMRESLDGIDALREAVRVAPAAGADYPNTEIGRELAMAARLVAADLGTRVIHVGFGGFDTHANQAGQHERLLSDLARGVKAFVADLERLGRANDTLVLTMSEFGRRLAENGSAGTDHGTAAPLFAIGPGVAPGIHGAAPSLTDLHIGRDLKFTTDYRSVYATALERWLGVISEGILGGKFEPSPFVAALPG